MGFRNSGLASQGIYAGGRRVAANPFQAQGTSAYTSSFIVATAFFDYSAATLTLFENGTQTGSRTFQTAGSTENDAGALGVGAGGLGIAGFFNGDIAELVIIHSAVSTTLRETGEGALAHKWGQTASLDAAHPFKTFPPYA